MDSIQATADRGYYKGEDIAACAAAGIVAFVPKPLGRGAAASNGRFAKEAFTYDAAADVYRCPNGETLLPRTQLSRPRDGHRLLLYYHQSRLPTLPAPGAVHVGNKRWRQDRPVGRRGGARRDGRAPGRQPADDAECGATPRWSIPSAPSSTR